MRVHAHACAQVYNINFYSYCNKAFCAGLFSVISVSVSRSITRIVNAVSYTHLDVYKRQVKSNGCLLELEVLL